MSKKNLIIILEGTRLPNGWEPMQYLLSLLKQLQKLKYVKAG
jgi:hypothetical protein